MAKSNQARVNSVLPEGGTVERPPLVRAPFFSLSLSYCLFPLAPLSPPFWGGGEGVRLGGGGRWGREGGGGGAWATQLDAGKTGQVISTTCPP